ncbi:MAG: DNA primase [Spirochaetaceae bacterium]|nr:MAG: DNA primase [Spirochaetaceae bacterium]
MKIPEHVIEEIARKTDIVELVGRYTALRRQGNEYIGRSPFTNEKTPSFFVNPEKGVFHCFSSNKGGSVFTFVMEMEKLDFREAVEFLADKAGVAIDVAEDNPQARRRDSLRELYNRVSGSFRHLFLNSEHASAARDYMRARQISDQTLQNFAVGYAPADPDWLFGFLRRKQYSTEFLGESGLFSRRDSRRALFADRIIFPIHSARGDVIAFGGRRMGDFGPKYLNSAETLLFHKGQSLYGLFHALPHMRKARRVYLAEGYMDVLALIEAGITNAVAPLGTAFTEQQAALLRRYVDTVILLFDADSAGIRATHKAASLAEAAGLDCEACVLAPGSDPADILQQHGPQRLQKSVTCTITVFDYLLQHALSDVDGFSSSGREFVLKQLFPYIRVVESAVKRDSLLQQLADRLGVDRQAMREDFFRRGERSVAAQPVARPSREPPTIDLFLMLATVANRDYFPFVRKTLTSEDLKDPRAREVFVALEECYRKDEQSIELLLSRIERPEVAHMITERLSSDEFRVNPERAVRDAVYRIKERSLKEQQRHVDSLLRRGHLSDTEFSIENLLQEKMVLDRELRKLKVILDDRTAE